MQCQPPMHPQLVMSKTQTGQSGSQPCWGDVHDSQGGATTGKPSRLRAGNASITSCVRMRVREEKGEVDTNLRGRHSSDGPHHRRCGQPAEQCLTRQRSRHSRRRDTGLSLLLLLLLLQKQLLLRSGGHGQRRHLLRLLRHSPELPLLLQKLVMVVVVVELLLGLRLLLLQLHRLMWLLWDRVLSHSAIHPKMLACRGLLCLLSSLHRRPAGHLLQLLMWVGQRCRNSPHGLRRQTLLHLQMPHVHCHAPGAAAAAANGAHEELLIGLRGAEASTAHSHCKGRALGSGVGGRACVMYVHVHASPCKVMPEGGATATSWSGGADSAWRCMQPADQTQRPFGVIGNR